MSVTVHHLNYLNAVFTSAKGYATEARALKKLEEWGDVLENLPCAVLCINGRYVPIVFLRNDKTWLMRPLADDGIAVTN